MAIDLTFKSGASDTITVKCEDINWKIQMGPTTFSPATLKILGDLWETDDGDTGNTTDRKFHNLILDFGKMTEVVTFTCTMTSDDDFHTARKWVSETSYFAKTTTNPIHFYWGADGDPFYYNANDVTNLGAKYEGAFIDMNMTQKVPSGVWKGTIKFAIGRTVMA